MKTEELYNLLNNMKREFDSNEEILRFEIVVDFVDERGKIISAVISSSGINKERIKEL
ncbi:MAG: hypothetical protein ACTSYR_02060 [Candidatus Odinarchaeia archaeon]